MPRMRRGKAKEWQAPQLLHQCLWCGKVIDGPEAGSMLDQLRGGEYSGSYCENCRPENEEGNHRMIERRRMERAGVPEEEWPPLLPSRLEQRTGSRYGVEAGSETGTSDPPSGEVES